MRPWHRARAAARRLVGVGAIVALVGNAVTLTWEASPRGPVVSSGSIALLIGGAIALVGLYRYTAAVDEALDDLDQRLPDRGPLDDA
jgi:hypothetical protein